MIEILVALAAGAIVAGVVSLAAAAAFLAWLYRGQVGDR